MISEKPRIRVKAGGVAFPNAVPPATRARPQARWMRDSASGVLAARRTGLIDSREDIRRVWDRVSSVAIDLIQNSGRLKGAVDQVIADTVGAGLKLSARPDLSALGYSAKETATLAGTIEKRWRKFAENPDESDFRGKFTLHQQVDIGLRQFVGYGEAIGVIDFMPESDTRRYGIEASTKLMMIEPHRLVRDTMEIEGLHSGVIHDANGRPVGYRFNFRESGLDVKRDYRARDDMGRTRVVHAFDPWSGTDVRGISVLAAALRTQAMAEQLSDVTLETAILQTVFAATLVSPEPSKHAFEAIEALDDIDADLKEDFLGYFGARMDKARESAISINGSQVSHLAPGEELKLQTASTPGAQYLPFSQDLRREIARALGLTYESLTLDHRGATYSSVRMGNASIWPVVLRRRERIAAPIYQAVYEAWLDEEIFAGRIPVRGGYAAFRAHRHSITWAEWQGPAKPTADDLKSAKAAKERLGAGLTTLEHEAAEYGLDWRDVLEQRREEAQAYADAGLPNPFIGHNGRPALDDVESEPTQKDREDA